MTPGRRSAWTIAFALLGCGLVFCSGRSARSTETFKILWGHREAYAYMASAMVGMLVLVFIPVVYGISLGFQRKRHTTSLVSSASRTLPSILSDFNVPSTTNFYFTLGVTIMWTVVNVGLHVSIGLFLALLLNDQFLKARGVFRVILILPWAVPNYITALIWKGMFHQAVRAINLFLVGLHETLASAGIETSIGPISWFQSFWPPSLHERGHQHLAGLSVYDGGVARSAAVDSESDLYEAAIVDGASRWQRFRQISLPLLMPALVPGGHRGQRVDVQYVQYHLPGERRAAPNGATDILITDAFRWAFEPDDRPGYAAAYSTIIFLILAVVFTTITNRVTGATKGAFE